MDANEARTRWDTAVTAVSTADPIRALALCLAMTYTADDLARDSVDRARRAGRTWEEIGAALSISKQAAQQRFGA